MSAFKSVSQIPHASNASIARAMKISFMLTPSTSTPEFDALFCKPEPVLQDSSAIWELNVSIHLPPAHLSPADRLLTPLTSTSGFDAQQCEPESVVQDSPSMWEPNVSIHLPSTRLSPADRQHEQQPPRFTTVWNPRIEAIDEGLHHTQPRKPVTSRFYWPPDQSCLRRIFQPQRLRGATVRTRDRNRDARDRTSSKHSNQPYPLEQVDWIRYQKDDMGITWAPMLALFHQTFPDSRLSDKCLSCRYYRDNRVPMVEWVRAHPAPASAASAQLLLLHPVVPLGPPPPPPPRTPRLLHDDNGRIRWVAARVRDRESREGVALAVPYLLVDKHPERAVGYAWVSEEHKAVARRVLSGEDLGDELQASMLCPSCSSSGSRQRCWCWRSCVCVRG
jgi:hypothetical protein